jgi:hypothetical protein
VSDTLGTRNAGQPLEELVEIQALSIDLREAVMACLSGGSPAAGPFWNWLSFKNLGVRASRASVRGFSRSASPLRVFESPSFAELPSPHRISVALTLRRLKNPRMARFNKRQQVCRWGFGPSTRPGNRR